MTNVLRRTGIYAVMVLALYSCRNTRQMTSRESRSDNTYMISLPDSLICILNKDSSFYLCQDKLVLKAHAKYPQRMNPVRIIQRSDGKVIFREDIPGGTARWLDSANVELFYPSGIPRDRLNNTYLYNVILEKKIYKRSQSN